MEAKRQICCLPGVDSSRGASSPVLMLPFSVLGLYFFIFGPLLIKKKKVFSSVHLFTDLFILIWWPMHLLASLFQQSNKEEELMDVLILWPLLPGHLWFFEVWICVCWPMQGSCMSFKASRKALLKTLFSVNHFSHHLFWSESRSTAQTGTG